MHHCVRLHVATAALSSCSVRTSPCGHSSHSFLSSSWYHYNYHPPFLFFFCIFPLFFRSSFPSPETLGLQLCVLSFLPFLSQRNSNCNDSLSPCLMRFFVTWRRGSCGPGRNDRSLKAVIHSFRID